jgi:hypothetical protein
VEEKFGFRLKNVIQHFQHSVHSFGISLGYDQSSTVRNAVAGRSTPNIKLLQDLHRVYDRINVDWLITGRGSMMIDDEKSTSPFELNNPAKDLKQEGNKYIIKALEMAEGQIETLKKNQTFLEGELERLKGGSKTA